MKKVLTLFSLFLVFSCLDKKADEKNTEKQIPIIAVIPEEKQIDVLDGKLRVVFEGIFEKDDLFLLFYNKKEGEKLSNNNVLKKEINGDKNLQKVIFTFPETVTPFSLRFDFSDKKDQKPVIFKSIHIIDKFNKVVIDNSNLEDFFAFNNHMEYVKEKKTLSGTLFKIDGKDAYNPYFIANSKFLQVLKNFHEASSNETQMDLINDYVNTNFKDGRYRIVIDAKFKNDDLVLVYFEEDTNTPFNQSSSVKRKISGSNSFQKICFTLPKGRYPSKVSIDISNNIKQEHVELNSIEFFENKNSLFISKEEFSEHFHPNNYISYDSIAKKYNYNIINENGVKKYNPYFVSSSKLNEKLINF